jgi:hypothetical protein
LSSFTEISNQPRCKPIIVKAMENESQWIQGGRSHIHHMKINQPPVYTNSTHIPQEGCVKYLGLYPDRRLTWRKHTFTERKQLGMTLTKMCWFLGQKPKHSTSHKAILKRNTTVGHGFHFIYIETIELFQCKAMLMIVNAPWCVCRVQLSKGIFKHQELNKKSSSQYSGGRSVHPKDLVVNILVQPEGRRLGIHHPNDLPTRCWCNCLLCSVVFNV